MSEDEQMAIIGRMVTQRKVLQQKSVALSVEVARARQAFESLSGILEVYEHSHHETPLQIRPDIAEFLNVERVESLVKELLDARKELHELQTKLDQVS